MSAHDRHVERLYNVVRQSLFTTRGTLDYDRVADALISLASAVNHCDDGDSESMWYIGECCECGLPDLIVGAYWHYTEWHGGQWSKGYAALSALGQVYQPNMETVEDDNPAYQQLNAMAEEVSS